MLEQDSPQSASLSAAPSSRLGGKGQNRKKIVQVTHWPSQAGTPRRRERQDADGEIPQRLGLRFGF